MEVDKREDSVMLNITMTQFIYHFVVYAEYTLQMTGNFPLIYINNNNNNNSQNIRLEQEEDMEGNI